MQLSVYRPAREGTRRRKLIAVVEEELISSRHGVPFIISLYF